MKPLFLRSATIVVTVSLIAGCAAKTPLATETMYEKSSFLTKATKKLQVLVRKGMTDPNEMRIRMQQKYPRLMSQFKEYELFMKNDNGVAVILVCDKEMRNALLEDAFCDGAIEGRWHEKEFDCDFRLEYPNGCDLR